MSFRFFGKSLLFEGARCTSTGFQRHGSETSGEFVILLRYDILELWETGRGAESCGVCRVECDRGLTEVGVRMSVP